MIRRIGVAMAASAAFVAASGLAQFGLPSDLAGVIFGGLWLGLPFVPVWIGAAQDRVNTPTICAAFAVAAASTVIVHRLVQRSIEGDTSSTAALIHIYDPVLGCLAVGIVFAAAWAATRLQRRAT